MVRIGIGMYTGRYRYRNTGNDLPSTLVSVGDEEYLVCILYFDLSSFFGQSGEVTGEWR